ncbi:MAG: outer membrane beta-barrel protein [Chitinophagaceae bacterium]
MKQLLMLVSLVAFYSYSNGQSPTIVGNVTDSTTGEMLTNATVQLMRVKDSVIIRKIISQRNGFVLSRVPAGDYQLLLSYIGYCDTTIFIKLDEKDTLINLGIVHMRNSSGNMMEVVVRSVIPPVIIRNDTIIYNTEAFKTKPNATVAELLKQLPGMEVDREGNVSFQGERVQKIYVDGKEFFLNDPKLATQNLLADMIQKVEAFNDKSQRAKLTGIRDNNPGKAINLRLKADKKKGWLGTLEAGYASEDRYGIKATANHFNGDEFIMATINSNNGGNVQNGSPELLGNKQNNSSLNYRNNFSKKLELTANYAFNNSSSRYEVNSNRETFFTDSSFLQDKQSSNSSGNKDHGFNTSLNYTIDSFNLVNLSASLGLRHGENNGTDNAITDIKRNLVLNHLNNAFTNNQNSSDNKDGSLNISYSHVFRKKGRYLGVSMSSSVNANTGQGKLHSLTRFYNVDGIQTDSLERNQRSNSDAGAKNTGIGINYTEPIGKNQVIDVSWSISNGSGNADRYTYNYNGLTGKYDEADSLASNAFKSTNASQQFSIGYNYFNNKLQYQLGFSLSKSSQQNTIEVGVGEDITQKALNLFPRASFMYTISKQKNLQVSYNGSTNQPSITQLQPVPDYSNPLLVHLGNPGLKQEFSNNLSVNYNYFSPTTVRSFQWAGSLQNTANRIVNATITDARGVQEQRFVNVPGNYTAGTNINFGLPLGKNQQSGAFNSSTRANYVQDVNLVNGEENIKRSWILSQSIGINYHKADKIYAGLQAGINWNRSSYSIQTLKATNFLSQRYSCNLSVEIFQGFFISSDLNLSFTNSQGALAGRNAKAWNATAMKRLFQNKAELKFSVFDILNSNNSFNQNTGDNYIETTEQEVMKRVFILSFMYRFTRVGS